MSGDIAVYLSGGAGNSDPAASLGGAISSTELISQTVTAATSNITGINLIQAYNCNAGSGGLLRYDFDTMLMYFTPPGGAEGSGVSPTAGRTLVYDSTGEQWVMFEVTPGVSALPMANAQDALTVANNANNLFDDISASESKTGRTEYRCIYIKNNGAVAATIKPYFLELSSGADGLAMSWDDVGGTGDAATVGSETTEPGISPLAWYSPIAAGSDVQFDIAAGEFEALWIRRTIRAGNTLSNSAARFVIGLSVAV